MLDEPDDRPRERLLAEGVTCISDAELLTVLLGTGIRGMPADQLAEQLLRAVGGLGQLARARPHELLGIAGIGVARAARITAAFDLGRRALARGREHTEVMLSAEDIYRRLRPRLIGLTQEVFVVVALNARGMVIDDVEVARGTLDRVEVHPRDVFRPLIRMSAASAVVAHNHPSGLVEPSPDDVVLSERLRAIGELVGIPILDHVIVGDDAYCSIAEHLGPDCMPGAVSMPD
ncbi:MAG: DNA repair protein RadC [Deltaproteobacteria bacterium]|nr:DNA repair protein RadC [Deltaproteobacteria bacterium]